MCVERVREYYGMAAVLSGREVGVAEWVVSCVHMGGEVGVREWATHEYYGIDGGGGGPAVRVRWKDSCAYGM